jgi:hypothetical protein
LPPLGRYTTFWLLLIVSAMSLAASMRRSSTSPAPAALVASLMSLAASLSPSARMIAALRSCGGGGVCVCGGRLEGGGSGYNAAIGAIGGGAAKWRHNSVPPPWRAPHQLTCSALSTTKRARSASCSATCFISTACVCVCVCMCVCVCHTCTNEAGADIQQQRGLGRPTHAATLGGQHNTHRPLRSARTHTHARHATRTATSTFVNSVPKLRCVMAISSSTMPKSAARTVRLSRTARDTCAWDMGRWAALAGVVWAHTDTDTHRDTQTQTQTQRRTHTHTQTQTQGRSRACGRRARARSAHLLALCEQLLCVVLRDDGLDDLVANGGQHALLPVHA